MPRTLQHHMTTRYSGSENRLLDAFSRCARHVAEYDEVMPETPLARAVSAVLRGQIAKARVEQIDLARELGMSKYQVGRLVTGKTVMGIDDADMLCAALGIDLLAVIREAMDDTPDRPRRLRTDSQTAAEAVDRLCIQAPS